MPNYSWRGTGRDGGTVSGDRAALSEVLTAASSVLTDALVGKMNVLWWGRPGPRPMPDRGPRNPAPLSSGGGMTEHSLELAVDRAYRAKPSAVRTAGIDPPRYRARRSTFSTQIR